MLNLKAKFLKLFKDTHTLKLNDNVRYVFLIPVRARIALRYLFPNVKLAFLWLIKSRETANFTYELTPINNLYLAHIVSIVTGKEVKEIKAYISELKKNTSLKKHIAEKIDSNTDKFRVGPLVAYGRRAGWYAVVRATKPNIVVETGVEQGLGSCVIVEALKKNEQEGFRGKYFGTDIRLEAGQFFTGEYRKYGEILYGDSLKSLKKFKRKIDVFINDSDHSHQYEAKEYNAIKSLLKNKSIVMGDNSRGSPELCRFAERTGRKFLYFGERPKNHWYHGAGIGFAYDRQ